ncbi:MAG: EamA family transporter, partial [Nitrospinota bacterium]|nr:EamA family transporter [Nitrospinota bacterium]
GLLGLTIDKTSIRITPSVALLGLLPTVFFSIMPLFMRMGMRSLPNPVLGTFLAAVGALAALLAGQGFLPRADRWGVNRRAFGLLTAAGLCYTAAFFTFYEALGSETVSFVTPLVFTSPLFAMLISRLFFQDLEQVTWKLAVGGVVVFLGVVAISLSRGG